MEKKPPPMYVWHQLDGEIAAKTSRMRIPGGWLYRSSFCDFYSEEHGAVAVSMVFVPDPTHEFI